MADPKPQPNKAPVAPGGSTSAKRRFTLSGSKLLFDGKAISFADFVSRIRSGDDVDLGGGKVYGYNPKDTEGASRLLQYVQTTLQGKASSTPTPSGGNAPSSAAPSDNGDYPPTDPRSKNFYGYSGPGGPDSSMPPFSADQLPQVDEGYDPFADLFGDSGLGGATGPSPEELAIMQGQLEETKRANQAAEEQARQELAAAKNRALADTIGSLFSDELADLGNRRSGAVNTLATALPRAITDEGAALLGRQIPGMNNGQPIQTTDVPLDTAAINPTDIDAVFQRNDQRGRGLIQMAHGGYVESPDGLYRAADGAITPGTATTPGSIQTANIDPILAAQAQAMADLRDYANQFGTVPQAVVDATLAYYNVPPGSVVLPPSLTKQTLDQANIQFYDEQGRLHQEFESRLAQDRAIAERDNATRERIASGQNANALEIARGHDTTTLQGIRMQIGSDEKIAGNALAENRRQFDLTLQEDQRQNLAEMAANPRRVIEAAYYQSGNSPTAAATAMQNQISPTPPGFTGAGVGQGQGAGTPGTPGTPAETPDPTVGEPAVTGPTSSGRGAANPNSAFAQANAATMEDRQAQAAQRAASPASPANRLAKLRATQEAQKAAGLAAQNSGANMVNQAPVTVPAAGAATVPNPTTDPVGYAKWKDSQLKTSAEGSVVSEPGTMAALLEGAILRRMATGGVVKPPVASSMASPPKKAPIASSASQRPSPGPRGGRKMPGLRSRGGKVGIEPWNKKVTPMATGGTVEGPAVILVGEGLDGSGIRNGTHEYVLAPPGTVIAPADPSDKNPTMQSAMKALRKQMGKARMETAHASAGKIVRARGMKKAAQGYIDTTLQPGLTQGRRGSAYDPLGGANAELRASIAGVDALPTYKQLNSQSGTQRGLFEAGLSAGGVEPQDVIDFINRGYEGFNAQVGAGRTARIGRGF